MKLNNSILATEHTQIDAGLPLYQLSGNYSELGTFAQCTDFIPMLEGFLKMYRFSTFLKDNTSILIKANKILLSLAPKVMQTILAPYFLKIYSDKYFSF